MVLIIRWSSANEIKVVHQYKAIALKRYHIVRKASGPLIDVYINAANEFLLLKRNRCFLFFIFNKDFIYKLYLIDIPRLDWDYEFLIMCNRPCINR